MTIKKIKDRNGYDEMRTWIARIKLLLKQGKMITDKPNLKNKTNTPKRKENLFFILRAESGRKGYLAIGCGENGSSSLKHPPQSPI
jgi:hypothetical protein